jgi:MarR family transcriptional regulator, organic hydroperoxide resistance regulator
MPFVASHMSKFSLRLEDQICFAVHSTSLALDRIYRPRLKAFGLTYPQYLVMLVLWQRDGLTVGRIGSHLYLDSATLTPLLKRLEQQGLVNRVRNDSDEREVLIHLSPKGRQLKSRVGDVPAQILGASGCSVAQLEGLKEQLDSLRGNLLAHA